MIPVVVGNGCELVRDGERLVLRGTTNSAAAVTLLMGFFVTPMLVFAAYLLIPGLAPVDALPFGFRLIYGGLVLGFVYLLVSWVRASASPFVFDRRRRRFLDGRNVAAPLDDILSVAIRLDSGGDTDTYQLELCLPGEVRHRLHRYWWTGEVERKTCEVMTGVLAEFLGLTLSRSGVKRARGKSPSAALPIPADQ